VNFFRKSLEERRTEALERIADALETAVLHRRPAEPISGKDETAVMYTDDEAEFWKEFARDAYVQRGGKPLKDDEPLPSVPAKEHDSEA
jgi:hypothetical protein